MKAKNIWPIFHFKSNATKQFSKKEWRMGQIIVAFSEYLNFKCVINLWQFLSRFVEFRKLVVTLKGEKIIKNYSWPRASNLRSSQNE